MPKHFEYSIRRYYGELEDDFDYELFAESLSDALLLIVADLNDVHAETKEEAKQKAKEWLYAELGASWTVEDALRADLELRTDAICYRLTDLREVERIPA